jgi:hypothetical protein
LADVVTDERRPFAGYGKAPDGSRIRPDGRGGIFSIRPSNVLLRDIRSADRLLEVFCYAGGSRRGRLTAVVTRDWQLSVRACVDEDPRPGTTLLQCRCGRAGHRIDHGRLAEVVDLKQHQHPKARHVDIRGVEITEPRLDR